MTLILWMITPHRHHMTLVDLEVMGMGLILIMGCQIQVGQNCFEIQLQQFILSFIIYITLHRWCNHGKHARLKCCRLWVRASIGSNQMLLVFVASLLSTQHLGERSKTGWHGIGINCPSGVTCLSADCCFSELAPYKSN